ncbi:MAG: acetyl-CoA carboxylase carboxyltransferase subunit alpha [Armatimonadetes bacterium]|nr:acetyl-CoA carboxylase carboxyltransferase subunit alpha [Armatimonadota bacterium]
MANLTVMDFEKSIAELDANLTKLRQVAQDPSHPDNTPELHDQIAELEQHRTALLEAIYSHLTPWDKVLLARHERRPYTLDYIGAVFTEWQELHGDRLFADDGAIVAGLARLDGWPVAVIGHQKGRDIRQRQQRNFGYARPEGYRKAGRVMKTAAKFGMPVITLVDTAGAAADVAADERGISEAIARAMFDMATLTVPIVSVIIGEGGSGGALGLAVADRVLMLEHSIYSVIAPEGCAAILWRDPEMKAKAADQLNLTAQRARELGIIDDIIPEPLGGAHRDWEGAGANLKRALTCHLDLLLGTPPAVLTAARYEKFRRMGRFGEAPPPQDGGDGEAG